MMNRISPYVRLSEDSYYGGSFNVDIRVPKSGHIYLETGSHCVLEGSFVFEKFAGNTDGGGGLLG